MHEKLIVALDVDDAKSARVLIAQLKDLAGAFKIGSQLFTCAGPGFVREVVKTGARVFLDLKFHDIPNTVAAAAVEATRLGVFMFNVHASGGAEMMRRTKDAVDECVSREKLPRPLVIAVTVLTSSDRATLAEVGFEREPANLVRGLALLAEASGLDGVVASPQEVGLIRDAVKKPDFALVTPGVRPHGSESSDQKRIMTPRDAMAAGSTFIVVGRPIIGAVDPRKAAQGIIDEMGAAVNTAS